MAILSTSIAGRSPSGYPTHQVCSLPARGALGRSARLGGLTVRMADRLVVGRDIGAETAVIIGTALGSVTETMNFVESMIQDAEANPMPRAFVSSVHNSIASSVAIKLGAHGACQTLVHGPVSWAHALFAAAQVFSSGSNGLVIAGGVDEWSDYIARGGEVELDAQDPSSCEGGGLVLLTPVESTDQQLAVVRNLRFGRTRDPARWLRTAFDESHVDVLLLGDTRPNRQECSKLLTALASPRTSVLPYAPLVGTHPAAGAAAFAFAAECIAGRAGVASEVAKKPSSSIGVATVSHLGDIAYAVLERAL